MEGRRWTIPPGRIALGAVVLILTFVILFRAFRGHVVGSWSDPDDWRVPAAMAAVATVFAYTTLLALAAVLQALGERCADGVVRRRRHLPRRRVRGRGRQGARARGHAGGAVLRAPLRGLRVRGVDGTGLGAREAAQPRRRARLGRARPASPWRPAVIDGFRGPVRLLGWSPLGTRFPTEWFKGAAPEPRRNLRRLIDARQYETLKGTRKLRLVTQLFDLQSDDDGALRKDWCLDEDVLEAPESVLISESVDCRGRPGRRQRPVVGGAAGPLRPRRTRGLRPLAGEPRGPAPAPAAGADGASRLPRDVQRRLRAWSR